MYTIKKLNLDSNLENIGLRYKEIWKETNKLTSSAIYSVT